MCMCDTLQCMSNSEEPKPLRKLTVNEQEFVREMTRVDNDRPRTATEAYRRVYKNNNSRQTCNTEASLILKRPHIKHAIAVIEDNIELDRRRASRGTAQAIQNKLWNIVERPTTTTYEEIAALKTLASLLPKNALESSPNDESASSKQQLIDRLKEVLSDVPDAIDVTPESDTRVESAVIEINSVIEDTDDVPDEGDEEEETNDPEY